MAVITVILSWNSRSLAIMSCDIRIWRTCTVQSGIEFYKIMASLAGLVYLIWFMRSHNWSCGDSTLHMAVDAGIDIGFVHVPLVVTRPAITVINKAGSIGYIDIDMHTIAEGCLIDIIGYAAGMT